jgi:hypothetical protein
MTRAQTVRLAWRFGGAAKLCLVEVDRDNVIGLVSARLARLTNLVDLYRYLGGGWLERTGDPSRAAEGLAPLRP